MVLGELMDGAVDGRRLRAGTEGHPGESLGVGVHSSHGKSREEQRLSCSPLDRQLLEFTSS